MIGGAVPREGERAVVRLADVRAPVANALTDVRAAMERIVIGDAPLLATAARHLLATRGKLFRPTLTLLSSATGGAAPSERAITLAATVELIHMATLVHDDAVDHSVLRRGVPTINSLYNDQVSVILGDFLYLSALAQLAGRDDLAALRPLVDASTRMTVGELRQLSGGEPLEFSEEDYELLISSKTASLIEASCHVGALCGVQEHIPALRAYGDALGMAFQIVDDLIDYTEDPETTGKPTGKDVREKKVTLPLIAALRVITPPERATIERVFADPDPDERDVADVVDIVRESGGLSYARARGEHYAREAAAALTALPPSPVRDALDAAILYAMERHA